MPPKWLPSDEDLRIMLDTRVHSPWFLWAYVDIVSEHRCVLWSRDERPPLRESFGFRLAACAAVPPGMIPP